MKAKNRKSRVVGWIGFSDGKPFFEQIRDGYSDGLVWRVELFKSRKAARLRFEHVECVELSGPGRSGE